MRKERDRYFTCRCAELVARELGSETIVIEDESGESESELFRLPGTGHPLALLERVAEIEADAFAAGHEG